LSSEVCAADFLVSQIGTLVGKLFQTRVPAVETMIDMALPIYC